MRRSRRHHPQPPEAAKAKLAEKLLETAAAAHDDALARWRNTAQIGEAYLRLERDGDVSAFDGVLVPDVAYVMYVRVERRRATRYARRARATSRTVSGRAWPRSSPAATSRSSRPWLDSPADRPCTARPP